MLKIPHLARCFVVCLLALGLYLAIENLLISAEVLADESGASVVSASAISTVVAGIELVFASWVTKEKTLVEMVGELKKNPASVGFRLAGTGLGLGLLYHFDILTTAKHPQFSQASGYFFGIVVMAYVFGPEVCIVLASWLWRKATDAETKLLAATSHKDAENAYRRAERSTLIQLAEAAGKEKAIAKATERWSNGQ